MTRNDVARSSKIAALIVAAATVIVGMFLPLLTVQIDASGMINPIWGSAYGIGFAALNALFGSLRGGLVGLFYWAIGFVVWPALLLVCLYKLMLLIPAASRKGVIYYIFILLSLVVCVPIQQATTIHIDKLPIFTKYIDF